MDITGNVALVTGAASGLGEATARRLHAAGAVVVVADVNDDGGRKVAADLGGAADRCCTMTFRPSFLGLTRGSVNGVANQPLTAGRTPDAPRIAYGVFDCRRSACRRRRSSRLRFAAETLIRFGYM